ncbi:hypothetical protein KIN20_008783 [Parelaphostrongylus tenuis]|uniref:Uncharacterized protein n=1 Tax=Parelaphostrongylus tenuis TaxID=148309 RepID=A0AAD5QHS8_PARTN|nr:hypothetical protein KIN20_008783 [Parelaphostrongylus tenuis]
MKVQISVQRGFFMWVANVAISTTHQYLDFSGPPNNYRNEETLRVPVNFRRNQPTFLPLIGISSQLKLQEL